MPYSDDIKEQIREKIDIVDLIGKYIPLHRSGRMYLGLCPWHDDKKPSFQVNPERQSFKCWVCDIGGDIFSFVMKMEGVDFPGALEILADMAGIEYKRHTRGESYGKKFSGHSHFDPADAPPEDGSYEPEIPPELLKNKAVQPKPSAAENIEENFDNIPPDFSSPISPQPQPEAVSKSASRKTLFNVLGWVEKQYYESLLYNPMGERARNYLKNRGITEESIKKFRLGYCPEPQNWMVSKVNNVPRRIRLLTEAGILSSGNYGGLYDRFRDRVMFPIHNAMGQCIAFGGRMMDDTTVVSKAKYINSPETPLFSKRKQLYGLDLAKKTMSKTRRALVVEGYMDCIVAHQFGFTDTVAVLGTALGSKHIETLRHYVDRVILMLDGDAAGQKRTSEVLELFVSQNMDLQVVTLPKDPAPDGSVPKDPAEYLLAWGAEKLEELIQTKSKGALEHAIDFYTQGVDLSRDIHASQQALYKILELLAKIPNTPEARGADPQFREHQIILKLALLFRMDESDISLRIKELQQKQKTVRRWDEDDISEESESNSPSNPVEAVLNGDYPPEWGKETPYEREMFELLLNYPHVWSLIRQSVLPSDLRFVPAMQAYQLIQLWTDQGNEFTVEFLLNNLFDPRMKAWIEQRQASGALKPVFDPIEPLNELLVNFRNYRIDRQKQEVLVQLEQSRSQSGGEVPWNQILHNLRTRHGISEPTDGNDRGVDSAEDPPF